MNSIRWDPLGGWRARMSLRGSTYGDALGDLAGRVARFNARHQSAHLGMRLETGDGLANIFLTDFRDPTDPGLALKGAVQRSTDHFLLVGRLDTNRPGDGLMRAMRILALLLLAIGLIGVATISSDVVDYVGHLAGFVAGWTLLFAGSHAFSYLHDHGYRQMRTAFFGFLEEDEARVATQRH